MFTTTSLIESCNNGNVFADRFEVQEIVYDDLNQLCLVLRSDKNSQNVQDLKESARVCAMLIGEINDFKHIYALLKSNQNASFVKLQLNKLFQRRFMPFAVFSHETLKNQHIQFILSHLEVCSETDRTDCKYSVKIDYKCRSKYAYNAYSRFYLYDYVFEHVMKTIKKLELT